MLGFRVSDHPLNRLVQWYQGSPCFVAAKMKEQTEMSKGGSARPLYLVALPVTQRYCCLLLCIFDVSTAEDSGWCNVAGYTGITHKSAARELTCSPELILYFYILNVNRAWASSEQYLLKGLVFLIHLGTFENPIQRCFQLINLVTSVKRTNRLSSIPSRWVKISGH